MSNAFWFGFYAAFGAMLAGLAATAAITILTFLTGTVLGVAFEKIQAIWKKLTIKETE